VIKFVDYGEAPTNPAQRLQVIQKMWAHAQYCFSGDSTLEATQHAIEDVVKVSECVLSPY
jgi:hypothetical protein